MTAYVCNHSVVSVVGKKLAGDPGWTADSVP
jgi:hypothetical protein